MSRSKYETILLLWLSPALNASKLLRNTWIVKI